MKLNVTMNHPSARIVSAKSQDRVAANRHGNSVLDDGPVEISSQQTFLVHLNYFARRHARLQSLDAEHSECRAMQMNRMIRLEREALVNEHELANVAHVEFDCVEAGAKFAVSFAIRTRLSSIYVVTNFLLCLT